MTPSYTPGKPNEDNDMAPLDPQRNHDTPSIRASNNTTIRSSLMTPSPRYAKQEAPFTAATESMTPMTAATPEESVSTNPGTAPTTAPRPRALDDEDVRFDYVPRIRGALFPEDHASPRQRRAPQDRPSPPLPPFPSQVEISHASSLPEPPVRNDFVERSHIRTSSSGSLNRRSSVEDSWTIGEHSYKRTSSSESLRRSSVEDPWTMREGGFGIQERRRSSSTSFGSRQRSFHQTPRNASLKLIDRMTPETVCSSSDSSPDVSPSPDRSEAAKRRRRPMSPLPDNDSVLFKILNKLNRIRTNRLVMILCLVGMASLVVTVLTSRAVLPDAVLEDHDQQFRPGLMPHHKSGVRGAGSFINKAKRSGREKAEEKKKEEKKDSHKPHDDHKHDDKKKEERKHHDHKHDDKKHVDHKHDDHKHHDPKHDLKKHDDHKHDDKHHDARHEEHTSSIAIKSLINLSIVKPKPIKDAPITSFEAIDEKLYMKPKASTSAPRILKLHESSSRHADRKVELYPSDFTDSTQLYGVLDSDDERLAPMEMRDPYSEGECVPMQDWQTTFHPSCNGMHELALEHMGQSTDEDVQLFGTKGYWRNAWKLDFLAEHDSLVLKTLKFQHRFEDAHFEHDRIDAVAMERLTASPHVINVFGYCGHSVLTEYADGKRLGELADKSKKNPLARLKIARDIAEGLADVHGIDGDNNATFVHLDVNPANVVSIGGRLKLNDFNIGIILRWNTTSNRQCGFPAQYPNPQWRSPEEARNEQNLTEKVDVFSMGHIFFRLICGHEPWNKLEPGGRPSKEEVHERVQKGDLPFIPEHVMKSTDPEEIAIRDVMLKCYTYEPENRPSAREVANMLDKALSKQTSESRR